MNANSHSVYYKTHPLLFWASLSMKNIITEAYARCETTSMQNIMYVVLIYNFFILIDRTSSCEYNNAMLKRYNRDRFLLSIIMNTII